MRSKLFAACLGLALALTLSGCGYPELYERVLVHGIGVDWNGREYQVTVRSSASAEDEGEELFTSQGKTVLEALSNLSLSTGREPFYSHNYLVVFGMDCARRGLDDCLDFFVRYYNTRPAVKMFLAEGTAEEVLSTENSGKLMKMSELQALAQGGRYNGQTAQVELLDFVNGLKGEGSSPVLPVLRPAEDGVEVSGTAYFNGYQAAGMLTREQTRGWLAVMDQLETGELAVEGGEIGTVTLSLREVRGKISAQLAERPEFQIQVEVDADISAADGPHVAGADFYAALEDSARRRLQDEVEQAVEQAVKQDRCDIFGFGNFLFRKSTGYWRQNAENWSTLMAECRYQVSVNVKVRRLEQENQNGLMH